MFEVTPMFWQNGLIHPEKRGPSEEGKRREAKEGYTCRPMIQITQGARPTHNITHMNNHQPNMVKILVEGG